MRTTISVLPSFPTRRCILDEIRHTVNTRDWQNFVLRCEEVKQREHDDGEENRSSLGRPASHFRANEETTSLTLFWARTWPMSDFLSEAAKEPVSSGPDFRPERLHSWDFLLCLKQTSIGPDAEPPHAVNLHFMCLKIAMQESQAEAGSWKTVAAELASWYDAPLGRIVVTRGAHQDIRRCRASSLRPYVADLSDTDGIERKHSYDQLATLIVPSLSFLFNTSQWKPTKVQSRSENRTRRAGTGVQCASDDTYAAMRIFLNGNIRLPSTAM